MSFCITRIEETPHGQTVLPGSYEDHQQAELALKEMLAKYNNSGRNDEQGYWWAYDAQGQTIKFLISRAS